MISRIRHVLLLAGLLAGLLLRPQGLRGDYIDSNGLRVTNAGLIVVMLSTDPTYDPAQTIRNSRGFLTTFDGKLVIDGTGIGGTVGPGTVGTVSKFATTTTVGDSKFTDDATTGAYAGPFGATFLKLTPQDTDPVGVANSWLWLTSHAHANPDEAYVYLNGVQRRVVVSGGAALLGTDTIFPVSTATTLGLGRLAATGTGISCGVASGVWTCNNTGALLTANTFTAAQTFQGATPIVLDGATAGTNATTVTVTDPTGARTFTVPDADSVAVQPQTCAAGQHVTAISAAGVVTCTDPILNKQDAAAEITGDGTDLTIYTYTVPANTIPSGGCIRAQVFAQHTTGTDATTYKWYFGGTSIANSTSTSTGVWGSSLVLCNNTGVTNAQTMTQHAGGVGSTSQAAIIGTPAEDTTAAIILKATFSVANSSKITPKMFLVWHQ